jgi:hypothetical protein
MMPHQIRPIAPKSWMFLLLMPLLAVGSLEAQNGDVRHSIGPRDTFSARRAFQASKCAHDP